MVGRVADSYLLVAFNAYAIVAEHSWGRTMTRYRLDDLMIRSPIKLNTDWAILLQQDGGPHGRVSTEGRISLDRSDPRLFVVLLNALTT